MSIASMDQIDVRERKSLKDSGADLRTRVVIENIRPQVDGGRFPIKRVIGETVTVEADAFNDGHDLPACILCYWHESDPLRREIPMTALPNDKWKAEFRVDRLGRYGYTVEAYIDRFRTWREDLTKRVSAGQDVTVDLQIGAQLVELAAEHADSPDRDELQQWLQTFQAGASAEQLYAICHDIGLGELMRKNSSRKYLQHARPDLEVIVDRERARFSAWYEMFPRSASSEPGRHGTLKDCESRLSYVSGMGFGILYLPPVHPIGHTHRKGKNNATTASPDDVGSPWAIGGPEGGHKSVHPALGTLEDFDQLVNSAKKHGLEIALDIAFQCSPDHPYVKEHPEWFRHRPDGTIQYAENPPKKYQDIYPFDFECDDWRGLWEELKSVFEFWIGHGVQIFRVDNPHTKPFAFWEWTIASLKSEHPGLIFLSEAFTRPKIMARLAKVGFTQSYTYFAWRNTKRELTAYLTELTKSELREFLRPNFWPNTPDILTEYLQLGGRPAFVSRAVLAAMLGANYGVYGPAFELCWNAPREPGSEEYLDSEKYELKWFDPNTPNSLYGLIARLNRIRRDHRVLQTNESITFHHIDNEEILAFSKRLPNDGEMILVVVNLDPHHRQSGWIELPLEEVGLSEQHPYQVHDVLSDARYMWHGARNFVELDPAVVPAHVFRVRRHIRTERDFEYYL